LLAYPEESAGGIMTTEYISIPAGLTAEQTSQRLREIYTEAPGTHYLYVTDEEDTLLGVISLWDLVVSEPNRPVREFMVSPAIQVQASDSREDVAAILAKYNLLALPVTDASGRMLGIVTVDDAIDSVIPGAWKRRLPRVFG
jgi:Mg/Co/Ni transporter MgtE